MDPLVVHEATPACVVATLSSKLWLLLPPPLGETSSCSQISSQLSKLIDITDVKSVLWWKRLQHRNIINYPPVFHQMTSLISAVPDGAAFVVTVYVRVCACVRVCLCVCDPSLFLCVFVDTSLCVCKCWCILYMCCLHVFKFNTNPSYWFSLWFDPVIRD